MKWRIILAQLSLCLVVLSCGEEGETLVTAGGTGTSCVSDLDCKGDRICLSNGKCSNPVPIVNGETGAACGSNLDCKGDRICLPSGKCSEPDPDPPVGDGNTGSPCVSDLDCKGDSICPPSGKCSEPVPDPDPPVGDGDDPWDYEWVWGVGNCEWGMKTDSFHLNPGGTLVKDFSSGDLDPDCGEPYAERYDAYICALSKEPNLYSGAKDGKVCLVDNLVYFTNEPYPGQQGCWSWVTDRPWYNDCFTGDLEP